MLTTSAYKDFAKAYDSGVKSDASRIRLSVLVLGPSAKSKEPAAVLRKHVASRCRKDGKLALQGEHKSLLNVYRGVMGRHSDLCTYELDLALRVDALVIIPSSPGSFVELGMLALAPKVCPKTIVLFDRKYARHNTSFVKLGAKKAYTNKGATTAYVDYADKKSAWKQVQRHLQVIRTNKFSDTLLSKQGSQWRR